MFNGDVRYKYIAVALVDDNNLLMRVPLSVIGFLFFFLYFIILVISDFRLAFL